ncbi:putative papain-like cysteine peptidase superfamily [Helianthus anomalus]
MYKETYTYYQRLNIFSSNFEDIILKYEVKKLESVDLMFSSVLQGDHFYVLCFHLKTDKIELIDNSTIKQDFKERYLGLPDTLRRVLVLYLQKAIKPTLAIKALETSVIERKEMEWRTLTNGIDCGVFTMRHMEAYKGKTPWFSGFVKEDEVNKRQNSQLHLLRHRYMSKIILSEYNLDRQRITKETIAFDKTPENERDIKDLDKKIPERLKEFIGKDK